MKLKIPVRSGVWGSLFEGSIARHLSRGRTKALYSALAGTLDKAADVEAFKGLLQTLSPSR